MDHSSMVDHQEKMGYFRDLFPIIGAGGIPLPAVWPPWKPPIDRVTDMLWL